MKAAGEYLEFPDHRPQCKLDYIVATGDGDKFIAYWSINHWVSRETDIDIPYEVVAFAEVNDYVD